MVARAAPESQARVPRVSLREIGRCVEQGGPPSLKLRTTFASDQERGEPANRSSRMIAREPHFRESTRCASVGCSAKNCSEIVQSIRRSQPEQHTQALAHVRDDVPGRLALEDRLTDVPIQVLHMVGKDSAHYLAARR